MASPLSLHSSSRRQNRRQGQALILAVLIMVFAALLAAAFVTVVAINLNQTARQSDKTSARQAAQAGLDFVNRELTYSEDGPRWFEKSFTPAYFTSASTDPFYYSSLDRAHGWAGSFVKFPDPRTSREDATPFLVKVEQVPYNLVSTDADFDKAGALKITVIGLASDDPSVYHQLVAYKGGIEQAPLAQVMRTVSNWDFVDKTVPVAEVASFSASTPTSTLNLKNAKGSFPTTYPFTVMIGDPATTGNARAAVITGGTSTALYVAAYPDFTLVPPATNARVELAASLGAPSPSDGIVSGLDYKHDGSIEPIPYDLSKGTTTTGGVRVNGGLWWQGTNTLDDLVPRQAAYGATLIAPGYIKSSGLMAVDTGAAVNVQGGAMTAAGPLASSIPDGSTTDPDFPDFPGKTLGWISHSGEERDQLVSDGWNRIAGIHSARRQVRQFTPPDLTVAGNDGLDRYRRLSKFSNPLDPAMPASAAYGYGEGIYLDNRSDRERHYDGTRLREMKQDELVRMWMNQPEPGGTLIASFGRTPDATTPVLPATDANASLEDQHLRGWIGPEEFQARGALVEIDAITGKLWITRDSRGDGTSLNQGPTGLSGGDNLAWKAPTGATLPGVYRLEFDWPANGVVFAEGNIRIRCLNPVDTGTPPRSLTVVSMNNIYIEGTVNAGDKKLLLLARRNVVLNPTKVISRLDVQTRADATAATTTTVSVENPELFQAGDWVKVDGADAAAHQITLIAGATLTVAPAFGTAPTTNAVVRSALDALDPATSLPRTTNSIISTFDDVLARRVVQNLNDPPATTYTPRLLFSHNAERRPALTIGFTGGTPGSADMSVRKVTAVNQAVGTDAEGIVHIAQSSGVDDIAIPTGSTNTLANFKTSIDSTSPSGSPTWSYNSTILNSYDAVPSEFLAGVGNRAEAAGTGTFPWTQNLVTAPPLSEIPMGLSLGFSSGPALLGASAFTLEEMGGTTSTPLNFLGRNPASHGVESLDQTFYPSTEDNYSLSSFTVGPLTDTASLGFAFDSAAKTFFTNLATASDRMPWYRLSRLKLDSAIIAQDTLDGNKYKISAIAPPRQIEIKAFVYAQQGSWFVIPGDYFDSRLHGDNNQTYMDWNNDGTPDANEYVDADASLTWSSGDFADINRDGIIGEDEKLAASRYLRDNYKISFTGAIMENQTALINDIGTGPTAIKGAVKDWTDKWATTEIPDAIHAPAAASYGVITYTFDESVAKGLMEDDPSTTGINEADDGFRLPQSPDLIYQG